MRNPPTVERDRDQHHPAPLRPPHPHLARYLAEGDELLEGEQLCVCGALEGDHLVVNDTCPRTGCFGFEADPDACQESA